MFCSRTCAFARQHEQYLRRQVAAVIAREQQKAARARGKQEQEQRIHQERMTCRLCGGERVLGSWVGRRCLVCYAQQQRVRVQRGRARVKQDGVLHLCPNCGQWFRGYEQDVFCSKRCSQQLKPDRYPRMRHVPIAERNELAAMTALIRRANRVLQGYPDVGGSENPG